MRIRFFLETESITERRVALGADVVATRARACAFAAADSDAPSLAHFRSWDANSRGGFRDLRHEWWFALRHSANFEFFKVELPN